MTAMAPPNSLQPELAAIVGEANVQQRDAQWVVQPGGEQEVVELVRFAYSRRLQIVPLGARTHFGMAGSPVIALELARMAAVLELDPVSLLVRAQAGLTGIGLERLLLARGLSLGDYPPAVLRSSLGGMVSVRTPGKSSMRHGFFEDAVLALSYVLSDGRLVHADPVPRRAAGPDPLRAICGSEGTLAVVTSVTLRVHHRPEKRLFVAYRLPSLPAAVAAVYLALREEIAPSGLRLYDAQEAAVHFGEGTIADGECLMVMTASGSLEMATCDCELMASAVIANGGSAANDAHAELWWKRLYANEPTPVAAPTLQITASPRRIAPVYHAVRAAAGDVVPRIHVSRFDANGAILFISFGPEAPAEVRPRVLAAAAAAGGVLLGALPDHLATYGNALGTALDPRHVFYPALASALGAGKQADHADADVPTSV